MRIHIDMLQTTNNQNGWNLIMVIWKLHYSL
jgi:hypothetical protein